MKYALILLLAGCGATVSDIPVRVASSLEAVKDAYKAVCSDSFSAKCEAAKVRVNQAIDAFNEVNDQLPETE